MSKKLFGLIISTFVLLLLFVYPAFAAVSTAPAALDITVTNNFGAPDTVQVGNLSADVIARVYTTATGGSPIAVSVADVDSATLYIEQLGVTGGTVYVSVTTPGNTESTRTAVTYEAEPASTPILAENVTVQNNATGQLDVITVINVAADEIIKAYPTSTAVAPIAVAVGTPDAKLFINQLGSSAGTIYVAVKSPGQKESTRTAITYEAEAVSTAPLAADITVTNNKVGVSDTVEVAMLFAGDVVKVYSAATAGTLLGTATVETGMDSATVTIAQLGAAAGRVYVTVTTTDMNESARVAKDYDSETTVAPLAADITITNNYHPTIDTVEVVGLGISDVVKVYSAASGGTVLGTAVSGAGAVVISVDQLGANGGTVYVTATSDNKLESPRTAKTFASEPITTAPLAADITVENNATGTNDTVLVANLAEGNIVKVYSAATAGTVLGTATVATGETSAVVSIAQLGTAAGNVYVSVKEAEKLESTRIVKAYIAEPVTTAPVAADITITNNATGTPDTVAVANLVEGDVVKVYSAATAGTVLGTATVATGETSATVSITQLGTAAGNVYVSVKGTDKNESTRTTKAYTAEPVSTAPVAANIAVTNNKVGTSDEVVVNGLAEGDVVKVYSAATAGT
ncbi:MAG: hypothetical protein N3B21_16610, partial [Clostridia bacterium]|nr:hypothetical protein [Clostridia bacterium]